MAKPPFKFRPTSVAAKVSQTVKLHGSADVPVTYSDTFVVLNEAATGMASLYFYQRQLDDRSAQIGSTVTGELYSGAKCVSRIVLSPLAIEKLLIALAENRGFDLTPKAKEEKE